MKRNVFLLVLFLLTISIQSCLSQKSMLNDFEIDDFVSYAHANKIFSGSVIVVKNDTTIYKRALGYQDFNLKVNLTENSKFLIASLSKPITAIAVMQLKEKGLLSYDDPLSNYFTEFPQYSKSITLKNLLNHTSGITNHYDLGMQEKGMTNQDVLNELVKHDLLFTPGTKFKYSNSGYILLAMIIEKITNNSYRDYIAHHIFEPLGMDDSIIRDEMHPNVTNLVNGIAKYDELHNYPFFTTGATGIYSTIEDLMRFDKALYTDKIIKQETLKEAFKPTYFEDGTMSNYGFGWHVSLNKNNETEKVFHTGGAAGYTGLFFRDLKNKHTVIFLANNRETFNLSAFADALTGCLYGRKIKNPKIPISIKLNDMLNQDSTTDIELVFNSLKKKENIYTIDEDDINEFGYYLMEKDMLETANSVFKINTELFPKSWNVFDSYAESFLKLNVIEKAKKYYLKSFNLNPEIEDPKEALKKIMKELD